MKKKLWIGLLIYLAGFILFFLVRFVFGLVAKEAVITANYSYYGRQQPQLNMNQTTGESYESFSKSNYASYKRVIQKEGGINPQTITVDQKYEKVATIRNEAADFDKSDKELREAIKKHNAVIQYEQNSGLKGSRFLNMTIGVLPDLFDAMVDDIKKIGSLKGIEINKFDKTSEYKDINAKKKSLEKARDALVSLKNKNGKVSDFIDLEYKILDIEKQIQDLGVKLGDYSEENELCTVKLTLIENTFKEKLSFFRLFISSLEWSIKYYGILTAVVFLACLTILIILAIAEKLKIFKSLFMEKE